MFTTCSYFSTCKYICSVQDVSFIVYQCLAKNKHSRTSIQISILPCIVQLFCKQHIFTKLCFNWKKVMAMKLLFVYKVIVKIVCELKMILMAQVIYELK